MKKQKVTLLIDQDDVLAEYIKGVTEAFNQKYHTHHKAEDCIRWNLQSIFGEEIDSVMHEPELFRKLEPVPYAIEVFERLYMSGLFNMYIVTAAHPRSVEAKYEWIREYLPFFPEKQIIVCSSKFMVKGDYLLDDGMHNIIDFQKNGGKSIVFERPHNKEERLSFRSVSDWRRFEEYIIYECYPEEADYYFNNIEEKAI